MTRLSDYVSREHPSGDRRGDFTGDRGIRTRSPVAAVMAPPAVEAVIPFPGRKRVVVVSTVELVRPGAGTEHIVPRAADQAVEHGHVCMYQDVGPGLQHVVAVPAVEVDELSITGSERVVAVLTVEVDEVHIANGERVIALPTVDDSVPARIYRARRRGDRAAVRRLQRLLVSSRSAKLLAVRRVTQDNRGKRTAGVDGVKRLSPPQRLALADTLALRPQACPTRRVWIPKPGTTEQRPLGIPTLHDRAAQALLGLALEPEWEAVFEPNSYGFRPGRSAHDAVGAVQSALLQAKFVLDADITKCFDRIDHTALLRKLDTRPAFRRVIRAWLKAGVMEGPDLFPTDAGTLQGGVISPLLANIALHGLEDTIRSAFPQEMRSGGRRLQGKPQAIRYADDFIILHHDIEILHRAHQLATAWLADMGLELGPSKTRIVHSLDSYAGQGPGFDFLGFTVRQFPAGKTRSAKVGGRTPAPRVRGFKTLVCPSSQAQRNHGVYLTHLLRLHRTSTPDVLIRALNPVIAGWANYFRAGQSKAVFAREDHRLFLKLWRWAKRRHPHKPARWVIRRYWHPERGQWCFGSPGGLTLRKHAATRLRKPIKVKGDASPYNNDRGYWGVRRRMHPELPTRTVLLLKKQRGRCRWCGLTFGATDAWELDHIIPQAQGGADTYANLQLLHPYCHDLKTTQDILGHRVGVSVTTDQAVEEPDAVKVARPVLQGGGAR